MSIFFKKLNPLAKIPTRATNGDAGLDLCATEEVIIPYTARKAVGTGLAVAIPYGSRGQIHERSGLALNKGIKVGGGVIDCGYRGELKVILFNFGAEPFHVKVGDKIAQLVIDVVNLGTPVEVETLDETERGTGGFGSSDAKEWQQKMLSMPSLPAQYLTMNEEDKYYDDLRKNLKPISGNKDGWERKGPKETENVRGINFTGKKRSCTATWGPFTDEPVVPEWQKKLADAEGVPVELWNVEEDQLKAAMEEYKSKPTSVSSGKSETSPRRVIERLPGKSSRENLFEIPVATPEEQAEMWKKVIEDDEKDAKREAEAYAAMKKEDESDDESDESDEDESDDESDEDERRYQEQLERVLQHEKKEFPDVDEAELEKVLTENGFRKF
nr:dUTP diphosphatase [Kaumoebavirus]